MRKGLLAFVFAFIAFPLYAQSTLIRVQDPSTNLIVHIGDSTNNAMRVNMITCATCATATNQVTAQSSLTNIERLALQQNQTASAQYGSLNLATVLTTPPTYTNGLSSALNMSTTGGLRVDVMNGRPTETNIGTAPSATLAVGVAGAIRLDTPGPGSGVANGATGALHTGAYGQLWTSFVDPGTGLATSLSLDAVSGSAALNNGPQQMYAYRATLSGTATVSDGAAIRPLADGMGRSLQGGHCPGSNIVYGTQTLTTTTASTSIVAAQGANVVTEIWDVNLGNTSTTNATVDFRDGTAGSVLDTFVLPAGVTISRPLATPIRTTANTALAIQSSASVSSVVAAVKGCKTR